MTDIKQVYEAILTEADKDNIVSIPLKDLIWTMVIYSKQMRNLEDEIFSEYPYYPSDKSKIEVDNLIKDKEYKACRRDELARLITKYSEFDTQKIWAEVDKLFKDYRSTI